VYYVNGWKSYQLEDYLNVLDKERIAQIASMKLAFDRLDKHGKGTISAREIKSLFKSLGISDAGKKAVRPNPHPHPKPNSNPPNP
jgi:hypothetical protein